MPQPPEIAAIGDELYAMYADAWANIEQQLARLLAEPGDRTAVLRRRLLELSRDIAATMDDLDVAMRGWVQLRLPLTYGLGASNAAAELGDRFQWAQHHRDAVQVLARTSFDDLLAATRYVRADAKRLVREMAREQTLRSVIQGETAARAGRSLAANLRQVFGVEPLAAVRYSNGARHGLADYADTVIRTTTATAFNQGTLNAGADAGVTYVEVFDGPDCGWSTHDDSDKANGTVRPLDDAMGHSLAHPRCARSFGMRPDITTKAAAKKADRFTPAQRAEMAAAERARAARQPRRFARDKSRARRRSTHQKRQTRTANRAATRASQPTGPTGPAVSTRMNVKAGGRTGAAVDEALATIDGVHGDGVLPELPINAMRVHSPYGRYSWLNSGAPHSIDISIHDDHPVMTTVHEVGHFLDHYGIGAAGTFQTSELAAWRAAVDASEAIQTLRAIPRTAKVPVDERYVRYLLKPEEMWARSYAQYIGKTSNSQRMLGELERLRQRPIRGGLYYPSQWDDDDFEPIAAAIDDLFKRLGWRR